jgi:hypothetical protein
MYQLFCGSNYYPSGGAEDYRDTFTKEEDAIQAGKDFLAEEGCLVWANVFCLDTRMMTWSEKIEMAGDRNEERPVT